MKKEEKEIEELRLKANIASNKLRDKIDAYNNEIAVPALRKAVGKCFKYINSYGGSYERWPLYLKIIDLDEKNLQFKTLEFQRTSLEIVEIKLDKKYNFGGKNYFSDSNYIEIPLSEYKRAAKTLLKFVNEKLLF